MTTFSLDITVPDGNATDILNTITDALGYANGGVTRINFLKAHARAYYKKIYIEEKKRLAVITASNDSETTATAISFT